MKQLFTDQMGRDVELSFPPTRIISLVPSLTEMLCYIGLEKELVGITKFCVHPAFAKKRYTIIGGTKNLHLDKITALQPSLLIGNKEENQATQIKALAKHYPVWMSDVNNLPEALQMIRGLGDVCDRKGKSHVLATEIEKRFADLSAKVSPPLLRTAYLIWRKPYMVAASDTFIDDMLQRAGFENVFASLSRYPVVSTDDLKAACPELIFLSSEPYPFREKHIEELKAICPQAHIRLVDGELFSWYGSRLLKSAAYFLELQKSI
ncbi:MAG TPA: cobalamin-binding protein [Phaeodactylibacter sp.]|nr:cobalamin-binding protein [Phaeodactylibacter sp.]